MDTDAKKTAPGSTVTQLPRRRPLKSARVRLIKEVVKEQLRNIWNESTKTAKVLGHITKAERKGNKIDEALHFVSDKLEVLHPLKHVPESVFNKIIPRREAVEVRSAIFNI